MKPAKRKVKLIFWHKGLQSLINYTTKKVSMLRDHVGDVDYVKAGQARKGVFFHRWIHYTEDRCRNREQYRLARLARKSRYLELIFHNSMRAKKRSMSMFKFLLLIRARRQQIFDSNAQHRCILRWKGSLKLHRKRRRLLHKCLEKSKIHFRIAYRPRGWKNFCKWLVRRRIYLTWLKEKSHDAVMFRSMRLKRYIFNAFQENHSFFAAHYRKARAHFRENHLHHEFNNFRHFLYRHAFSREVKERAIILCRLHRCNKAMLRFCMFTAWRRKVFLRFRDVISRKMNLLWKFRGFQVYLLFMERKNAENDGNTYGDLSWRKAKLSKGFSFLRNVKDRFLATQEAILHDAIVFNEASVHYFDDSCQCANA